MKNLPPYARRAALVLLLVTLVVVVVSLDTTFDLASSLIRRADQIVADHKVGGALLFVLLSALSAMLAFFSTAIVVPVAVGAWGKLIAVLLLWVGWLIGGTVSYVIGRYLGRPVLRWFIDESKLAPYEERLSGVVSFRHVLLFQFALPSEIPGYVLGTLTYPFRTYIAALMIAELPFALGAVYLGESFLRRDLFTIIGLGIAGVLVTLAATSLFHSVVKVKPQ